MTHTSEPFCAFDPEEIEELTAAYVQACIRLQVYAADERGREIVASRIIDLARTGPVDAEALRDRVLAEAAVAL